MSSNAIKNTQAGYFGTIFIIKKIAQSYRNNSCKTLLLVEGPTDMEFVKDHLHEHVVCETIKVLLDVLECFKQNLENVNCRETIIELCRNYQDPNFSNYTPNKDKLCIYGIVDSDNRDDNPVNINTLFFTDTHDLETLILSTDYKILFRISEGKISSDDIKKALLLSYQLSVTREVIRENTSSNDLSLGSISGSLSNIKFNLFVYDNKINVFKLIHYVNNRNLDKDKINKIIDKVINNKIISEKVDKKTGNWKGNWKSFDYSKIPNFWNIVNGHDILHFLIYQCKYAKLTFENKNDYPMDRRFEQKLVEKYDYSKFTKTNIYKKMKQGGLLTL